MIYKKIVRNINRCFRSMKSIVNHPLTKDGKADALKRYFIFHIAGRLSQRLSIFDYVGNIKFVAKPGMAGIVGNIYTGLHDFEEGGFLLHLLNKGDLYVDVGANVGQYCLLAAGVCGVQTIAIEPIPCTVEILDLNVRINALHDLVKIVKLGAGATESTLYFTHKDDALNRVVLYPTDNLKDLIQIKVAPIDNIIGDEKPTLIKIDVEGYELEVIKGGSRTLQEDTLLSVILEMHGHEGRYTFSYEQVHEIMIRNRFHPFSYDPFTRKITKLESFNRDKFNTIYLRDVQTVMERLKNGKPFNVFGKTI